MPNHTDSLDQVTVSGLEELPKAAEHLVKNYPNEAVFLFEGEMGAGKTTYIKAICQALGVTDPVSSPTFSLVNEYRTARNKPVYHFDFYRIKNEEEALDIGFLEYLESGNMCLIEWPSLVTNLLPENYVLVTLENMAGQERKITFKSC
ncbi:MAG TPA: tRNA (adenosine(37)-N6)-threonylcarbamoyltransferase complex ATPase subunit type 1 TsaE [Adhaeribacter sp.]|nr:tRNA (adenosine(37)-N6)-threonylcarbamoyltransferase complex ATPase subunit type 1 TsaE [Adhaeribacter sp.]